MKFNLYYFRYLSPAFKKAVFYFLLISLFSCKGKQNYIHPEYRSITQSVYASGVVKSRNQYQVFPESAGILDQLYITEGDAVKTGQVIALIRNPAAVLNRQSSLASAQFNAPHNTRDQLQELQNAVEITRQMKQNDSLLYVRQQELWSQGIGARVELEQRELSARNADINYNNALLKYKQLKKQLDFSALQSQTNLALATSQEKDLEVKSQMNGNVFILLKEKGETVNAQTPIAIIGEKNNLYLELQIDENDISQVTDNQNVIITMDSYRQKVFEGKILKIYPMMNERSRTFTAEAVFTQRPEVLYPNLTVEANIIIVSKQKALLIPRSYLIEDQFVLLKDKKKVKVTIGAKDNQFAEIISGISEKDELLNPEL